MSEDFFFCFSLDFGQTIGPSLSEALFVFALHIIWAKKSDQISVKTFFFALQLILGKKSEKKICSSFAGSLIYGAQEDLGARYRPSYPLEKFLSKALLVSKLCASALMLVSHKPASSTFFLSAVVPSSHQTF